MSSGIAPENDTSILAGRSETLRTSGGGAARELQRVLDNLDLITLRNCRRHVAPLNLAGGGARDRVDDVDRSRALEI